MHNPSWGEFVNVEGSGRASHPGRRCVIQRVEGAAMRPRDPAVV